MNNFIKAIIILIGIVLLSTTNIYAQEKVYRWNDSEIASGELIGQLITIEGKVASVYNFVCACFIYFGDPNEDFMAVIYYSSFGEFDYNINSYFEGKTVKVSGVLEESNGQPIIVIKTKSQVEVLEEEDIDANSNNGTNTLK